MYTCRAGELKAYQCGLCPLCLLLSRYLPKKLMPFELEFTPDAWEHLQQFSARERTIVLEAISTQLCYEPNLETRNRKPLQGNTLATWELRIGKFRVFYDIEENSVKIVYIIAIGYKEHNQLYIGSKRFDL